MRLPVPSKYGTCPECHTDDGYLNVHKKHYFVCYFHKTAWFVGEGCFNSWKFETESEWQLNRDKINAEFKIVKPAPWGWDDIKPETLPNWAYNWVCTYKNRAAEFIDN